MKKILLLLFLSISSIAMQAGILDSIKKTVDTACTVALTYVGMKYAYTQGWIELPSINWSKFNPNNNK